MVNVCCSLTGDHWNLVQPAILPLGRFPVAVIADVKDKLWCSSGSQIYVVSKKGDRIQVSADMIFDSRNTSG